MTTVFTKTWVLEDLNRVAVPPPPEDSMFDVDAVYLIKSKLPTYEIEVHISAGPHRGDFWYWEYKKVWPNDTGIFEPPVMKQGNHNLQLLRNFLNVYADVNDAYTSKVCAAVVTHCDPLELWGARLRDDSVYSQVPGVIAYGTLLTEIL